MYRSDRALSEETSDEAERPLTMTRRRSLLSITTSRLFESIAPFPVMLSPETNEPEKASGWLSKPEFFLVRSSETFIASFSVRVPVFSTGDAYIREFCCSLNLFTLD